MFTKVGGQNSRWTLGGFLLEEGWGGAVATANSAAGSAEFCMFIGKKSMSHFDCHLK
jgi:hypothetical protein